MDFAFRSRNLKRGRDDDDFGIRIEGVPADKVGNISRRREPLITDTDGY
jgi:hypothetical protein